MENRTLEVWEQGETGLWHALAYIGLVGSNLFFILPAIRAFEMRFYTRAFIYAAVVFVSGFYHLCKPDDGICIVPFSILHFMDFTVSLTAVMSNLLFLLPFIRVLHPTEHEKSRVPIGSWVGQAPAAHAPPLHGARTPQPHLWTLPMRHTGPPRPPPPPPNHNGVGQMEESYGAHHGIRDAVRYDKRFVDTFLLLINAFVIGLNVALARGGDPPMAITLGLAGINLGSVILIWLVLWRTRHVRPHLDWRDFGIALFISLLSIALFIGMAYLPSYWIFHSIWHTFAAIGSFYLLESRCHTHSGIDQQGAILL